MGAWVIALLYALAQPRIYEAECLLMFYWPRTHQAHEVPLPDDLRLDRVQTVIEELPLNITVVLARITADDRSLILGSIDNAPAAETGALVSIMKRNLSVTINSDAMIAEIKYRHRDSAAAFRIMKLLVDDCLERERVTRLEPINDLLLLQAALTKELASLASEKASLPEGSPSSASADLDRVISRHRARLDLIPERIDQLRRSEPQIKIAATPRVTGPYFDWETIIRRVWPALIIASLSGLMLGVVARRYFAKQAICRTGISSRESSSTFAP